MTNKVINLLKNKPYIIPTMLLSNYKKMNITEKELIVLIYLINCDSLFNPKKIASELNVELKELMENITNLIDKDILKIEIVNNRLKEEHINLDSLYNKLSFMIVNDTKEEKNNLYVVFENQFGRTLSPIDYEIINDWQNDFSDEIIKRALKEAVFNGVNNLKYIDKIIRNWSSQGIKTVKEIDEYQKKYKEKKSDKELYDYDWLNDK